MTESSGDAIADSDDIKFDVNDIAADIKYYRNRGDNGEVEASTPVETKNCKLLGPEKKLSCHTEIDLHTGEDVTITSTITVKKIRCV